MSLPKRIEYNGAFYHVIARGNGFQWIYKNKQNLIDFVSILRDTVIKYRFLIHCFVLMRNHYHLLIETPAGNLSSGMKKLNRDFARLMNKYLKRGGSIFKHRYKAILIEKDNYYLRVLRYMYQNPIRAKIKEKAEEYEGSSLYYLINRKDVDIMDFIYLDTQRDIIGREEFLAKLIKWVNENQEKDPLIESRYKYLLGSENWIEEVKEKYVEKGISNEYIDSKKLMSIEINEENMMKLTKGLHNGVDIRIYLYSKYTGLTQKEIGDKVGIKKANTVGQRLKRFKDLISDDKDMERQVEAIEEKIKI